jgi:hypothetical protein
MNRLTREWQDWPTTESMRSRCVTLKFGPDKEYIWSLIWFRTAAIDIMETCAEFVKYRGHDLEIAKARVALRDLCEQFKLHSPLPHLLLDLVQLVDKGNVLSLEFPPALFDDQTMLDIAGK